MLEAGPSPAPGVDLFAHCLAGTPGGVAVVAVNTDRTTPRALTIPGQGERYTLTSSSGLLSHAIQLNGTTLALARDGALPSLRGAALPAGTLTLPPASITFLALKDAGHASCR